MKWTQCVLHMIEDGAAEFIELGPGNVLQGLILKINANVKVSGNSNNIFRRLRFLKKHYLLKREKENKFADNI